MGSNRCTCAVGRLSQIGGQQSKHPSACEFEPSSVYRLNTPPLCKVRCNPKCTGAHVGLVCRAACMQEFKLTGCFFWVLSHCHMASLHETNKIHSSQAPILAK